MRYIILVLGLIILSWGAFIFLTDKPAAYMAQGLKACQSIYGADSNQMDGLRCDSTAISSAESLKNGAIAGLVIGAVLSGFAYSRIATKKPIQPTSTEHADI